MLKKGVMSVREREARLALESISKGALADLVVDLLRRGSGDESLDGAPLVEALSKAFEPIAVLRGDRPIRR